MKAHQRIVRERMAEEDKHNLFGSWWENLDVDIKKASLTEINLTTARQIIEKYEYLGTMPNAPMFAYGIYYGDSLGGCVIYGAVSPPSVSKSVVSDKFSDKVLQLSRGACTHWAHPHSASKLIGYSLQEIEKKGWNIIIAYCDPDAGEIGTVYQATNWLYCGLTEKRPDYLNHDGSRCVGHMKKGVAKTLEKVPRTRKHKYIKILGDKKTKKQIINELNWKIQKAYPKR